MSKKSVAENKAGAYFGWLVILGFVGWIGWVCYHGYSEYSTAYTLGVTSANRFWDANSGKKGSTMTDAIAAHVKANQPHRPEIRWTWTAQGFKVIVLQMKPFQDWCYEQGWESGFHSVMDQRPKN